MNPRGPARFQLLAARSADEWSAARRLIQTYVQSLSVDLSFQAIEHELANLATVYGPDQGAMLLARLENDWAGCCALQALPEGDSGHACEMKRLYVNPVYRGQGLGRQLAEAVMLEAQRIGYTHMYLDTLDDMEAARKLYQELGFEEVPPYYFSPLAGTHFLRVTL